MKRNQPTLDQYFFASYLVNLFNFHGRATRAEFWGTVLFSQFYIALMMFLGYGIIGGLFGPAFGSFVGGVLSLVFIIGSLAVSVRRLHDIGRSGWWILIFLVPFVGCLHLFVWYCSDSVTGVNQYGRSLKYPED